MNNLDYWKKIPAFVETHDQFKVNQLRHLIRNAKHNGFNEVIRKIGREWYINEVKFTEWLDGRGQGGS